MKEFIEKQINSLQEEAEDIRKALVAMVSLRSDYFGAYNRDSAAAKYHGLAQIANTSYSKWFRIALQLVKDHQTDHEKPFIQYGQTVMGFLKYGVATRAGRGPGSTDLFYSFDRQIGILEAIPRIIEIKEADFQTLISAEFVEDELAQAEVLLEKKFLRCAGLLCGVALERHLQQLCRRRGIDTETLRGINALAQQLYKTKTIDKIQLQRIGHLAAIRNNCAHADKETAIKERDIEELFQQTSALVLIR